MESYLNEQHVQEDPDFPFIFHQDIRDEQNRVYLTHYHESIELLYFTKGTGKLMIGGRELIVRQGQCAAIPSGVLHSIHMLDAPCAYACLIIGSSFCAGNGFTPASLTLEPLAGSEEISRLFQAVMDEMAKKPPFYKIRIKGLALCLLGRVCSEKNEDAVPAPAGQKDRLVRSAVDEIRASFKTHFTIDDIAKKLHVSKFYLCRSFKEITGKTVMDYVNAYRCAYARQLLRGGHCNVTQAAYHSGFNNLSYFTRAYKRHMGALPMEDRRG